MSLTPGGERDRFARLAGHELRAPLRGIRTLVSFLAEDLDPVLTGESREMMELILARVARMELLIDALLAYSRAGRPRGEPEPVAVADVVAELAAGLPPEEGGRVRAVGPLPQLVTDREALETVLDCLISNAIKFGGDGGRVEVRAVAPDECWRFEITDDGPGIEEDQIEVAFEPFRVLQPRDDVEGSGLGLTIARRTVEGRGGRIGLRSRAGRGTTAWFTWPEPTTGDPRTQREDR